MKTEQLADEMATRLSDVYAVDVVNVIDAPSPRVRVMLDQDQKTIPQDVHEVLREYDADIRYPEITYDNNGKARLSFFAVPERAFDGAGVRKLRENGPSTVVTITPEALDASGLELGDQVELRARTGEVCMHRWASGKSKEQDQKQEAEVSSD